MLIMHNLVNRDFKCLQYQSAIFGYRERDAPSIEEIFAMSDISYFRRSQCSTLVRNTVVRATFKVNGKPPILGSCSPLTP